MAGLIISDQIVHHNKGGTVPQSKVNDTVVVDNTRIKITHGGNSIVDVPAAGLPATVATNAISNNIGIAASNPVTSLTPMPIGNTKGSLVEVRDDTGSPMYIREKKIYGILATDKQDGDTYTDGDIKITLVVDASATSTPSYTATALPGGVSADVYAYPIIKSTIANTAHVDGVISNLPVPSEDKVDNHYAPSTKNRHLAVDKNGKVQVEEEVTHVPAIGDLLSFNDGKKPQDGTTVIIDSESALDKLVTYTYSSQFTTGVAHADGGFWKPTAEDNLRTAPVADLAALKAKSGTYFEITLREDNNTEYLYKPIAKLTVPEQAEPRNIKTDDGLGYWLESKRPDSGALNFAKATDVNAVHILRPTANEIKAYATAKSIKDVFIYYTGTDNSGDNTVRTYYVDNSGDVTLSKDDVNALPSFLSIAGSLREGIKITPSPTDKTFSISEGSLSISDTGNKSITKYPIAAQSPVSFRYMDDTGADIDAVDITSIDASQWSDNGVLKPVAANNDATYQKVYIDTTGKVRLMYGTVNYVSINTASSRYTHEEVKDIPGYTFIGGFLIRKDITGLDTSRGRIIFASKWGEVNIGGSVSQPQLRGVPVPDVATLKALSASNYEIRKVLGTGLEYVFTLTADLTTEQIADTKNLSDNANTGKWVEVTSASFLGEFEELMLDYDIENSDHPFVSDGQIFNLGIDATKASRIVFAFQERNGGQWQGEATVHVYPGARYSAIVAPYGSGYVYGNITQFNPLVFNASDKNINAKLLGVKVYKKTKVSTVITPGELKITNPNENDGTKVLKSNSDGSATFKPLNEGTLTITQAETNTIFGIA